jgi:Mitochondrial ribosomal protein L51 / S25 / CI-B8 domain
MAHRQFVVSTYPTLKQYNPDLPILIREAQGTPARAFARFGSSATLLARTRYSDIPQSEVLSGMSCLTAFPPRTLLQKYQSYWGEYIVCRGCCYPSYLRAVYDPYNRQSFDLSTPLSIDRSHSKTSPGLTNVQ